MNIKAIGLCAVGVAVGLPAVLFGVQQLKGHYGDKTNNFVLDGFDSWGYKSIEGGGMTFSGRGRPAVGVSVSQKLRVEALTWAGTASRSAAGTNEFVEATWSGNVHIVANRDEGKVEINVPKARFKNAERRFELEGGLVLVQTLKDGTMTLKAASGSVSLFQTKPADAPTSVKSAEVSGAVHVVMRTQDKGKPAPTVLTAEGDRVVYDAKARTLILTGAVKFTGDDSLMSGDVTGVTRAVITLDAAGKPIGVEMTGDPGVSHYTERKKGGH